MQENSQTFFQKNQLVLNDLIVGYDQPILEPLDFVFQPGVHILSGESGSGKSTLLKTLAGLQEPLSGTYSPLKSVMCFQEPVLLDRISVLENLRYTKASKDRIYEIADRMDLIDLLPKKANQISAGQRQRLALAMALLKKPEVLLLDEALAFQDSKRKEKLIHFLKKYIEDNGTICIWVTHSNSEKVLLNSKEYLIQNRKISFGKRELQDTNEAYKGPRT